MSKSNKYGYSGVDIPTQGFRDNKGKFDPAEINELVADNKWTQYGQLELIQTQTITSSTAYLDFINLADTNYNVHFLTLNNVGGTSNNDLLQIRFSTDNGSSFVATGYQYAQLLLDTNGSVFQFKSTNNIGIFPIANLTLNQTGGGYVYLYNLLDSSKYSFTTNQSMYETGTTGGNFRSWFGSGVLPTATTHNAFRLIFNTGNIANLQASLYGIRYA